MQETTRRTGGRHCATPSVDDRTEDGIRPTSSGRRALATPADVVDPTDAARVSDAPQDSETKGVLPPSLAQRTDASAMTRRAARAAAPPTSAETPVMLVETPAESAEDQVESRVTESPIAGPADSVVAAPREPDVPPLTRPLAVASASALARTTRMRRPAGHARRFTAFTASSASVGLAMSLMFALPADAAEPSTLSAQQIQTIVDSHGHTAAQILDVSADVTMPAPQRDNQIAAALTGIVSQEQGGADVATAQAAISNALQYGGARTTIVETALSYLGDPYVLGGASHSGIDCSGLVMVAYAAVGIHLGHLVSDEDGVATPITQAQALPGDIVVFNDEQHIGIYLGNGLLIQAPKPGTPVDIVPVWTIPHHFARILPAGQ
jgi:cell wall-associated NlpC family hydrolase